MQTVDKVDEKGKNNFGFYLRELDKKEGTASKVKM